MVESVTLLMGVLDGDLEPEISQENLDHFVECLCFKFHRHSLEHFSGRLLVIISL